LWRINGCKRRVLGSSAVAAVALLTFPAMLNRPLLNPVMSLLTAWM
jgi:hypothetical protein